MTDEKIVKCNCGAEFDLGKAEWCRHLPESGYGTKKCPKCGHCICHNLGKRRMWRPATKEENELGFGSMLKEEYGGVKE